MATIFRPLARFERWSPRLRPDDPCTQNLLGTTLAPINAIYRAPLFAKIVTIGALVALVAQPAQGLLQTTLSGPPPPETPPFVQTDWPNPTKATTRPDWIQGTTPQQFEKSSVPPLPVDWPNPIRPRQPTDWVTSLSPALTATPPKPFFPLEWPNPLQRVRFAPPLVLRPDVQQPVAPLRPAYWVNPDRPALRTDWVKGSALTLLSAPAPAPPFHTTDWPNPALPLRSGELRTWTGILAYLGLDVFYGEPGQVPPHEWTVPRSPVYPTSLRTWLQSPPQATPTAPIGSTVPWPNPLAVGRLNTGFTYGPTAFMPLTVPVGTTTQPNPLVARRPVTDWVLGSTVYIPTAGTPFTPIDWSNPVQRVRFSAPLVLRRDVQQPPAPLQSIVWDNPTRRLPLNLGWAQGTDLPLLSTPVVVPFRTTEWPNPAVPLRAGELRTWLGILSYLGLDTFYGEPGQVPPHEWVNPGRPALFRPDTSFGRTPPTGGARPFGLTDWPNPHLRVRDVSPTIFRVDAELPGPPPQLFDWTIPSLLNRRRELGFVAGSPTLLAVPVGSQLTPPNPQSRFIFSDHQRASTLFMPLTVPVGATWTAPNILAKRIPQDFFVVPTLFMPLTVPVGHTWTEPNPRLVRIPADWFLRSRVLPIEPIPFIPVDWTNPLRQVSDGGIRNWTQAQVAFLSKFLPVGHTAIELPPRGYPPLPINFLWPLSLSLELQPPLLPGIPVPPTHLGPIMHMVLHVSDHYDNNLHVVSANLHIRARSKT